ncbi:50S ribosomal protein L29 [Candidatus Pacearchaeota archaeon]|nr:50S ribosomal protein L29 [Candidatus Pacearchaeota archaeon]
MTKFKELSKLTKDEVNNEINEIKVELIKARVAAKKGGKVKIRDIKKTLSKLLMIQKQKTNMIKKS